MSLEKTLIAAGADCVAGRLILKHKVMGSYVDGAFVASEDGLEFAETAPAVKPIVVAVVAKGKHAKAAKHADESNADQHDLEDMLGE